MTMPKAYAPEEGYKYQILVMYNGEREYESLDYATDRADLKHLMTEYRLVYNGTAFLKSVLLPAKYWPENQKEKEIQKTV